MQQALRPSASTRSSSAIRADAQAGDRRGQRRRGGHRVLARARLRPHRRRRISYFLLAFVNVGLVADGGSSLLIPARVGFARAAEMAMLGERVPAPKALEWGLINRVVTGDTLRDRGRRARRPARGRPDALLRRDQAPAQRLAVLAHGRAARAGGFDPAGDGRLERLRRRRHGVRREAAGSFRGALTTTRGACAVPWLPPVPGPRSRRSLLLALCAAVRGQPVAAPAAHAGLFPDPAARRTPTASTRSTSWSSCSRCSSSRASRACSSIAGRVPRPQGPRRRADPRQHAARGRLDRGRGRDPHLHHRLHVPGGSATSRPPSRSLVDANHRIAQLNHEQHAVLLT